MNHTILRERPVEWNQKRRAFYLWVHKNKTPLYTINLYKTSNNGVHDVKFRVWTTKSRTRDDAYYLHGDNLAASHDYKLQNDIS